MDEEKLNEEIEEMETASIMLTDEDGKDTMFEFLDLIKYEDNEYIVLSPQYEEGEEPEDEEGHVVILRLDEETEDGGETYSSVDDDNIIDAVYTIFKEKWKNKYNFLAVNLFFLKNKSFIEIFTEYISYVIIFMLRKQK